MKSKLFNFLIGNFKNLLFNGLFLFIIQNSFAQSRITGTITDKRDGMALVGVTVSVKGTTIGTSTDLDGHYYLKVEPGTYTLQVRYISYNEIIIQGIKVVADKSTKQDLMLEEISNSMNEVEIKSETSKNSLTAINAERKNGVTVSDGVSSEQFKKTPDRNVSDVLKRVTGTSIQENKFAIIRGMNDRYNASFLNGAPLPSTESDRKAFSFNIIPSNLVDNLMIYKSPSPDMTADFAGGVIVIHTKNIPEKHTSLFNFSLGYHSLTTGMDFRHFRQSGTDFLGFDNGTRKMPVTENFKEGMKVSDYVDITKKFNNDWKVYHNTAIPNSNMSYNWGRSFKHNKNTFGTMTSFVYSNTNRFAKVQQKKYRYDDNNLDQYFTDKQYTNNRTLGVLINFSYKFVKNHSFSIKNLFNQSTDDITTLRTGLSSGENGYYANSVSNIYSQNRILSSQVAGEHYLSKRKDRLNWVLNTGEIFRSMPDYRIATYSGEGDDSRLYTMAVNNNQFSSSTGRFFSNMTERIYSGNVDYRFPFKFNNTQHEVKAGMLLQDRIREFKSRYFTYYGANGITGSPEQNLGDQNIKQKGVYMVEQSSPARDNYNARASLHASYLMMDSRLMKVVRVVYGVRLENYHQVIHTANGSNLPLVLDSTYRNIFPSMNLTWNIHEKENLRFSAGKTINRPEYRELAIFPFYNFNMNSNISGNTKLQPATIWNYDLRWELFPTLKEVISAGLFYKKIDQPIEMGIDVTQVSIRTFGYDNQKSADIYGAELDFRKSFDFISKLSGNKVWDNFLFFANLSLIKSAIRFKENSATLSHRPLQGQSPYMINSGMQYNNPVSGWGVNISYNKVGRRIAFVGAPRLAKFGLDIYENPRTVVDIQVSKSTEKWDYKLTIGDLLAQDLVYYQDLNQNRKYNSSTDNTIFRYNMGRSMSVNIAYKFR